MKVDGLTGQTHIVTYEAMLRSEAGVEVICLAEEHYTNMYGEADSGACGMKGRFVVKITHQWTDTSLGFYRERVSWVGQCDEHWGAKYRGLFKEVVYAPGDE